VIPARQKPSGFTLVEVLVATVLLSVVMAAVYTLFYSVIHSWRSMENDGGAHRKARNTLALLQRDYDNLFVPAGHLMEGTADSLTIYVMATPWQETEMPGPQLLRVRYRFDPDRGELEREEALVETPLPKEIRNPGSFDVAHVNAGPPERYVVARGLTAFTFRYVWVPEPSHDEWREAPVPVEPLAASRHALRWGLPQALDIQLSCAEGDATVPHVAERRMPTRAGSQRLERYQLENILGDAL